MNYKIITDKTQLYEITNAIDFINTAAINIVETRGGFHFIIEHSKVLPQFQKDWYNKMAKLLSI